MPVERVFREPLVFAPLSGHHRHTIILLHGRGFNAEVFSTQLLTAHISKLPSFAQDWGSSAKPDAQCSSISLPTTFREALPGTKFIFPWARKQRATVYRRSIVRQWFDDWHLSSDMADDVVDLRYDEGLQVTSLGETVAYLHTLIADEAKLLGGAQKVVLGGFSQGGASSLITALLWNGEEQLAAVIGMSAWLPYSDQMTELLGGPSDAEDDGFVDPNEFDPFEQPHSASNRGSDHTSTATTALNWLQEEIELPNGKSLVSQQPQGTTSVLLCHGQDDQQVYTERGHQATEVLPRLGLQHIVWRPYEDVGHEFSEDMLCDVASFLRTILREPAIQ